MKGWWAVGTLLVGAPLTAEVIPEPAGGNPRIQTVRWQPGETIQLTALPATGLTVMFEPGEQIAGVEVDASLVDARVSAERDALLLLPLREGALGLLRVSTARRAYIFTLRTGRDLMAAYLVRFDSAPPALATASIASPFLPATAPPTTPAPRSSWRIKGDREVQPAQISDDGARTYITFADGSALPAIFALGPTGEEQVVNGYMRGGRFVIDQVWSELVFRIDAKKATARRQAQSGNRRG